MLTTKAVAYYRVSTVRQAGSGLGLEAQRAAVQAYLTAHPHELVAELTEVESGRQKDRPKLAEAVALAKKHRAVLVIAKLDRLARSVSMIANLMDSGVEFVAADQPHANRLTIHLLASVAEYEAGMIATRTRAALAAAKARGTVLGNRTNLKDAGDVGRQRSIEQADQHARKVLPMLQHLVKANEIVSIHVAAAALNERGVKTARGGQWHGSTVRNLMIRCGVQSLSALVGVRQGSATI